MRLVRIALTVLVLLAAIAGGALWYFFYDNGTTTQTFPLDLAAIRTEAARIEGPGPVRIEVETVSHQRVPEISMVTGASWQKVDLVRNSYRLVWADGSSGIIDTGYNRQNAGKVDTFDDAAFARMAHALPAARFIVVTHEHGDHIGGLKALADNPAIIAHALLTPEQVNSPAGATPPWPAQARAHLTLLNYSGYHAIAPGVVLIRAPGHTPGSQMVYVRRADGREYIFMGDTASMLANVTTGHIRSHYVTDNLSHDDRAAVLAQSAALHALQQQNPDLTLVPGHDGAAAAHLEQTGALTPRFSQN